MHCRLFLCRVKKVYFLLVISALSFPSVAQSLNIPELIGFLDMPPAQIDTVLQKKGYKLDEKKVDSSSGIYNYSNLQINSGSGLSLIRSVNFMDVKVGKMRGRLLTYRTFSEQDYHKILEYLLQAKFKSTHVFDFKEEKHTLYEKDGRTVRLKVMDQKLATGKLIKVYEVEIGQ